jgi:hypothetical protein
MLNHEKLTDGKYNLRLAFNKKGEAKSLIVVKLIQIIRDSKTKRLRSV